MNTIKTRCGKPQVTFDVQEAKLLMRLMHGCIGGHSKNFITAQTFTYLNISNMEKNFSKEESGTLRTLFDTLHSQLKKAE